MNVLGTVVPVGWQRGNQAISGSAVPIGPRHALTCWHVASCKGPPGASVEEPGPRARAGLRVRTAGSWNSVTAEFLTRPRASDGQHLWEVIDVALLTLADEAPNFSVRVPLVRSISKAAWERFQHEELAIVGYSAASADSNVQELPRGVAFEPTWGQDGYLLDLGIQRRVTSGHSGGALLTTVGGRAHCLGLMVDGGPKYPCSVALGADRILEFLQPLSVEAGIEIAVVDAVELLRRAESRRETTSRAEPKAAPATPSIGDTFQNNITVKGVLNGDLSFDQRRSDRG